MPTATVDDARERRGQEDYAALRLRIPSVRARALSIVVQPGSPLERDDARTAVMPLSDQLRWQMQVAHENLSALDRLVQAHGLPVFAGYPLIRAAVESAAQAHWLVQHDHAARRVLRALRSSWWDHLESANFAGRFGKRDEGLDRRVWEALEASRTLTKALQNHSLDVDRISRSDMLTDVGRHLVLPTPSPLETWHLCSSLAHANPYTAAIAMQRTLVDPEDPRVHAATSSWSIVAALVRTSLGVADAALDRAEQLAATPR